jgi:hypothetical protein
VTIKVHTNIGIHGDLSVVRLQHKKTFVFVALELGTSNMENQNALKSFYGAWINGEEVPAKSGKVFEVRSFCRGTNKVC